MSKMKYPLASLGVAALLGSVMTTVPAYAGGGDFTEEFGKCTTSSTWEMKAKLDTGRIEMEYSVDTRRLGQAWQVRLTDNGKFLWSGNRTTNGVSRSFSVDKMLTNQAGADRLRARAVNTKTGEICWSHVTLRADGGDNSG